jgi:hypothetical protein
MVAWSFTSRRLASLSHWNAATSVPPRRPIDARPPRSAVPFLTLPGAPLPPPSCPRPRPHDKQATGEPSADAPPRRPGHAGRQHGRSGPALPMHSRPPQVGQFRRTPWAGLRPGTVRPFNLFLIYLIPRKWCKISKFVETCKIIQKWKSKFCMNTLVPLYPVGLIKLPFV